MRAHIKVVSQTSRLSPVMLTFGITGETRVGEEDDLVLGSSRKMFSTSLKR